MLDAVGDPLTNCRIYLELHNSYWPELDLPDYELIHLTDFGHTERDGNEMRRKTLAFLKVKDSSTDRIYLLAVPARDNIDTCQKARAWGFGYFREPDKFKPIVET